MNYAEAVAHLYGLGQELAPGDGPRRRFDLAHMRRLCAALGDPQQTFPSVLIAGTNGKGSTAATLASIVTAAGYRAGLYTSPHLVRVNERIQLAVPCQKPALPTEYEEASAVAPGAPLCLREIDDEEFARLYTQVDEAGQRLVEAGDLPLAPSFFERVTAVAFLYYASRRADLVVLEVGLGGRLDATNVVDPLLSILTDIALDHQEYLGDSITEIAGEKCGILRRSGTLITLPQHPEANQAIGVAATALDVRAISAADLVPPTERAEESPGLNSGTTPARPAGHADAPTARNRYQVRLEDGSLLDVDSPLPGTHQRRNLALAIAAAVALRNASGSEYSAIRNQRGYKLPNAAISEGIRNTRWPGRLEFVPPNLLLDVAHNPAGAWTLRSALASVPQDRPRTLLFSCLRDKNLEEMARILFPLFDSSADGDPLRRHDHILLAPIANPRATPVEDLLAAAHSLGVPAHAAPHLAAALAQACQVTPEDGLIVVTGSVYLVGEVRELMREEAAGSKP